jgi:heme A synthase
MKEHCTLDDFILTLHSYNVYLVILAGAITGIWGLILFFTTKKLVQNVSKPDAKDGDATTGNSQPVASDAATTSLSVANSAMSERAKPWRRALTVTIVLSLLQGLLGIIMVIMGKKPGPPGDSLYYLHFVYGGIVALVIPVATTYATGGKNVRRDILIYSIAALILTAAAVRAWMTGPAVFGLLP